MSDLSNPPAFPQPIQPYLDSGESQTDSFKGMTLRDYFAAAAMQGIVANPISSAACGTVEIACGTDDDHAKWAYKKADAMLKAREKQ